MRPQREPGRDPKAPAAASLDPPKQIRIRAGVGDPDAPSAATISASSKLAAAMPRLVVLKTNKQAGFRHRG